MLDCYQKIAKLVRQVSGLNDKSLDDVTVIRRKVYLADRSQKVV